MQEMSYVEKAIGAAGMTKGAAVELIGTNRVTFDQKLRDPGRFTFGEIEALGRAMDADARRLLWKAVDEAEERARDGRGLRDVRMGEYFAARKSAERLDAELAQMRARGFE